MQLTLEEKNIHQNTLLAGEKFLKSEWPVVRGLQDVEKLKLHKKLGKRSLFLYATELLKLSDSVALTFISVARKSAEVPALGESLASQKISVWKASRIVSVIKDSNASELIEFAAKNGDRKIDLEVGRGNPKALPKDKVKVLSDQHVQVTMVLSVEDFEKLKRVESLDRKQKTIGETVGTALETHLEKHDPVRKAKRSKKTLRKQSQSRKPAAAQRHAATERDEGRCTFVDEHGERCNCDRWTELHHIEHYAAGGSHSPENLTTLCWYHHDLVHQMSLPIDGQITWLRSTFVPYGLPNEDYLG